MKFRRGVLAGLTAMAVVSLAPMAQAACTNGDVTGGGVNLADVSAILACNGTRTSPPANPNPTVCNALCSGAGILSCGDLNLDGAITTADAILLINEIPALGGGPGKNVVPICTSPGPTVPCGTVIDATDVTNINSNRVLAGCEYFVRGTVFVQPGVVLTVRPGAVVKGVAGAPTTSALVFLASPNCTSVSPTPFTARINAAGTPSQPIVFTSDQPVGSRKAGDWGGLAFNGCSRVNDSGGVSEAEGLVGVEFGGGTDCQSNGGTAFCTDSSGLMRYVRTEFAGNELSPDNELNTYTQNALGSNTKFSYLQAHIGLDDNFEWFGGTITEKHFVSTGARDDNFDWQLGSDIKLQYGVAAQYLPQLDALADHGFEGDNNERGFTNSAISKPEFCNITVIGAKGQPGSVPSGGSWFGALLRRGTAGRIAKTIVTNFITAGFQMRDPESAEHGCAGISTLRSDGVSAPTNAANPGTCVGGTLNGSGCNVDGDCTGGGKCLPYTLVSATSTQKTCEFGANVGLNCTTNAQCPGSTCGFNNLLFRNTTFYNNGTGGTVNASVKSGGNNTGNRCNSAEWLALLQNDSTLRVKANTTFPDATIDPGIQAGPFWPPISFVPTNVANVTDDPTSGGFDCGVGFGPFFDSTKYLGGIDPNGTDWTQTPGGWISFATQ